MGTRFFWTLMGPQGSNNFASLEDAKQACQSLGLPQPKEEAEGWDPPRRLTHWVAVKGLLMAGAWTVTFGSQAYKDDFKKRYGVRSSLEVQWDGLVKERLRHIGEMMGYDYCHPIYLHHKDKIKGLESQLLALGWKRPTLEDF